MGVVQQDVQKVASLISKNNVPTGFVVFLLLQFLSMMADRYCSMSQSERIGCLVKGREEVCGEREGVDVW